MKRVYLAGAMGCYHNTEKSDYPYTWRKEAKNIIESMRGVRYLDYCNVIQPTDYFAYDDNNHDTEKEIMRWELNMVKKSDVVLANLRDLDKSIGTSDEILYAYMNNVPVIGFYELEDKDDCFIGYVAHPWKMEQIDRIETGVRALEKACEYIACYYLNI